VIHNTQADTPSVLSIIRAIKSGETDARKLSKDQRQACVEHMWGEGLGVPEMADVLKTSERTIHRDKADIQDRNALEHSPRLTAVMAGRLCQEAEICVSRIRRACRDKGVRPEAKIDAEHKCFQIHYDLARTLQSMGLVNRITQRIEAQLTHQVGAIPDLVEIEQEVEVLGDIAQRSSNSTALAQINDLRALVSRATLGAMATQLSASLLSGRGEEAPDAV
jgi:hypothetical protein